MSGPSWPACPACASEAVEVLHESSPGASTTHATLQCQDCDRVFKGLIDTPGETEVACVISQGGESRHTRITVPAWERLHIEDEVFGEEHRLLVTGIEHEDGRRVASAAVDSIKTLWCKVFDTVTIPVSVNKGHITHSDDLEVVPEEEFYVGDEIRVHGQPVRIHAIKTRESIRHHGSAKAREIVRMFAERADFREARKRGQLDEHIEAQARERQRREQQPPRRAQQRSTDDQPASDQGDAQASSDQADTRPSSEGGETT